MQSLRLVFALFFSSFLRVSTEARAEGRSVRQRAAGLPPRLRGARGARVLPLPSGGVHGGGRARRDIARIFGASRLFFCFNNIARVFYVRFCGWQRWSPARACYGVSLSSNF